MTLLEGATVVLPFRLASSRFPGKALRRFRGRTLLEHALINAAALGAREIVATAPAPDLDAAAGVVDLRASGARLVASDERCASATERVVQIRDELLGEPVLSLPIDEPALDPHELRRALPAHDAFGECGALTFYCDFFAPEDYCSPLSAKIVIDRDGRLLYMSRAVIPVAKDGTVDPSQLKKNVGAFVFSRSFLERLAELSAVATVLDLHEGLEQLRWLELGLGVRCIKIHHIGFGIDAPEQLALLDQRLG